MFNKIWFKKHQKLLLWFANTFIGRWVLCLKTSSVGKNKIIAILPNAIFWKKGKKYIAEFRTHNKFAKRIYYAFKPIWYIAHFWDMVWYPNFNLGFDTLTAYPAAGASSPVDGSTGRDSVDQTFGDIRAGAGTRAEPTDAIIWCARLTASTTSNQYATLMRAIFLFDTSALTASVDVSVATFSLYGQAAGTTALGDNTVDVVSSNPANTNNLVNGDFTTLGTTVFQSADIAVSAWANGAYNDFALNASGLANISKTGISKFGTRLGWDTDNSFGGSWSSGASTLALCYTADQAGTANDPKLVVTYALPVQGIYTII